MQKLQRLSSFIFSLGKRKKKSKLLTDRIRTIIVSKRLKKFFQMSSATCPFTPIAPEFTAGLPKEYPGPGAQHQTNKKLKNFSSALLGNHDFALKEPKKGQTM